LGGFVGGTWLPKCFFNCGSQAEPPKSPLAQVSARRRFNHARIRTDRQLLALWRDACSISEPTLYNPWHNWASLPKKRDIRLPSRL
jgi:hypothetical protein